MKPLGQLNEGTAAVVIGPVSSTILSIVPLADAHTPDWQDGFS